MTSDPFYLPFQKSPRTLPEFPVEIYEEIILYLRPLRIGSESRSIFRRRIRDLCNLSLVCRFLWTVTRPIIFENLFFIPTPDQNLDSGRFLAVLPMSVKAREQSVPQTVMTLVRRCVFQRREQDQLAPFTSANLKHFANSYGKTLTKMTHLTTIVLRQVLLTSELFENIADCPRLTALTIEYCESQCEQLVIHQFTSRFQAKLEFFRLLVVLPYRSPRLYTSLRRDQINAFSPLVHTISSLSTDSGDIVDFVINSKITPPLESVELLTVLISPRVVEFLQNLPSLTSLTMDGLYQLSPFSLQDFPTLRRLIFPHRFSHCLIGSHGLSHLSFVGNTSMTYLRSFAESPWSSIEHYNPISNLSIPLSFAFHLASSEEQAKLTSVTKLTISSSNSSTDIFKNREDIRTIKKFLSKVAPPSLTELCFVNITFDGRPRERDLIRFFTTRKLFPELERLSFLDTAQGDEFQWKKDTDSDEWKWIIPGEY
ncbi:hypothetical protein D9757_009782 [Collybiopsis confluens]|uniref:F-box domain-containing protein n=1 Tax=Collybiopsis confluens TaxID=2823264 RepID=A0A8H5HFR1_9AGAR|nr:hypothetical protein D9757_009782 [Collybiopsis confluens]